MEETSKEAEDVGEETRRVAEVDQDASSTIQRTRTEAEVMAAPHPQEVERPLGEEGQTLIRVVGALLQTHHPQRAATRRRERVEGIKMQQSRERTDKLAQQGQMQQALLVG